MESVPLRTVPPEKVIMLVVNWRLPPKSSTPPAVVMAPFVASVLTPPFSNSTPLLTVVPPV